MTRSPTRLFNRDTRAIVFGLQKNAIQRMLDFDYLCRRKNHSVAAVVAPGARKFLKTHWGNDEVMIPVYNDLKSAAAAHSDAAVLMNFASFRSAYNVTKQALELKSIRTVVIIAEGLSENQTRDLIARARRKKKWIIGPATVGGIAAGAFRMGNTAGTLKNIVACKLHRPGCVGLVSKSGGMTNELFNLVAHNSDGVKEGVAIGGDRFPGSTLLEHLLRYEKDKGVKMMVVLGEVGGTGELDIARAIASGRITKPVVAWVSGTCADLFDTQVQFGHAGAMANTDQETAKAKNNALKKAGAYVPNSFDGLPSVISRVFARVKRENHMKPTTDIEPLQVPEDHHVARKAGKVRRETHFTTTISDDRGEEATYGNLPISRVAKEGLGIGGVIGLLWFKKRLPDYGARFLELALVLTADHGPAVSGAHNAIVAARAGKDMVSSLASGLLTVGPRFGGAINGAAHYFFEAVEKGQSPEGFVAEMKKKGTYIPGIGHKIKSVKNPDQRVSVLKEFARKHFKKRRHLKFALAVEKITTEKRANLILNVDGCLAACFLDLMENAKFSKKERKEVVDNGILNGLFVLGRSIGIIGHIADQYRLDEGLYRHPQDDILYLAEKGKRDK